MFIGDQGLLTSAKSGMLKHFALCGDDKSNSVAINISPLCGEHSVYDLQRSNRRTFGKASQGGQTILFLLYD